MKLSQFDEPADVLSKRKPKSKKTMKGRNLAKELQEEEKTHDRLHKDANDSATSCAPDEKQTVDFPPSNLGILEERSEEVRRQLILHLPVLEYLKLLHL